MSNDNELTAGDLGSGVLTEPQGSHLSPVSKPGLPAGFSFMDSGWIKLHRKIWDNPRSRNPHWISVWVWMLCRATHSGITVLWMGKPKTLEPGQFTAGRNQISQETGVSPSGVVRVLEWLKTEHQIGQQTSNRCSLFTILNWTKYQLTGQQNGQPPDSHRTATGQPPDTKQECKKVTMEEVQPPIVPQGGLDLGLKVVPSSKPWQPDPFQFRLNALFKRRPTTQWNRRELKAYRDANMNDEDLRLIETYYTASHENGHDYRRRDILTLLNNWTGELDRARNFKPVKKTCL